ncbi:hypothetical protein Tco_1076751, partial [Tanacetum coccineum]
VMAAPVISISSDSSDESVGSSSLRVILIGSIHIEVPVASEVAAAAIASPAGDIPVGRLYRTYLGGPCRALTAKNSVRPLLSHRLASRYTSHHLDRFTSRSSSNHSSSDHSSLDHSSSGILLQRIHHLGILLWIILHLDILHQIPPLLIYLHSRNSFIHHLLGLHGISRHIAVGGALVPTRTDLLPPHKRFRDSISPKDSTKEEIDADVLADIEAETAAGIDVEAGIDTGIGIEADVGVDREYEVKSSVRGTVEIMMDRVIEPVVADDIDEPTNEDYLDMVSVDETREVIQMGLDAALQVLYDHMQEIPVSRITDIEVGQRQLEADNMIASGERAGLLDRVASLERSNARLRGTLRMESVEVWEIGGFCREAVGLSSMMRCMDLSLVVELASSSEIIIMTITRSGMTMEAIKELINRQVEEALAAYEANHAARLVVKSKSQNGDDGDNGNGRGYGNGNGRGNRNGNG